MLAELIENGLEAEKRKQEAFFELAERFRSATDPRKSNSSAIGWGEWFSAANSERANTRPCRYNHRSQ